MPELTGPRRLPLRRARVLISGDVQGVGFRWSCRERAVALSISGWVRNLPDGRVEAVFEGSPDAVDRMLEWCREGPGWAAVAEVSVNEEEPAGEAGFRIAR